MIELEKLKELKKQRDAIILAHYYVDEEVQKIADYVGDSYYLSKMATKTPAKTILFCGVTFMGESAKILNPEKTILIPDLYADCPMARMVDEDNILKMRGKYEDLAVVCYINSTAEIKALSDVCVTSSNAVAIVKKLSNKNIYFIPDYNLGKYVANQVPEKNFIFNDGFCHVHTSIKVENLIKAKAIRPEARILVHPECDEELVAMGDFVGSTADIIEFAKSSKGEEFIICTEMGILYKLIEMCPNKRFYSVGHRQFCPNMKRITIEKVFHTLENMEPTIEISDELRLKAKNSLVRMHQLGDK